MTNVARDKIELGVNIDHIAVLREARRINDPDPVDALGICKRAGADQITIHLREDRRHINDYDARRIMQNSALPVNLECAIDEEIIDIVCKLRPHRATLVPEKREEVTTEGGLDVIGQYEAIKKAVKKLKAHESMFRVSFSIGGIAFSAKSALSDVIEKADKNMYEDKIKIKKIVTGIEV